MLHLKDFKCFSFAGGERHFNNGVDALHGEDYPYWGIRAVIKSSNDLLDLMLVTDWLRSKADQPSNLLLPYMPYARQDRSTTSGSPFSLKVAANIINSLEYQRVWMLEPHSDVTPALINGADPVSMVSAATAFLFDLQKKLPGVRFKAVAPDAGASKRVGELVEWNADEPDLLDTEYIQALKHRNPATGHLEITNVVGSVAEKHCVIFDDICDGGATFIGLAESLKNRGAASISLFVAHGIFSKGLEPLLEAGIKYIGTTDSWSYEEGTHPLALFHPENLRVYSSL